MLNITSVTSHLLLLFTSECFCLSSAKGQHTRIESYRVNWYLSSGTLRANSYPKVLIKIKPCSLGMWIDFIETGHVCSTPLSLFLLRITCSGSAGTCFLDDLSPQYLEHHITHYQTGAFVGLAGDL